jgi:hypothetical protein
LFGNPPGRTAVPKITPDRHVPAWYDLIVFLAILAAGTVLVVLGHVTAEQLAAVCAALAALYGGWRATRR